MADFASQRRLRQFFTSEPPGACLRRRALPKGARVEIDAIIALPD